MSASGGDALDPLVTRILASDGGRKLLSLTEEQMARFLTSAERTLSLRDAGASGIHEHIEQARSTVETRIDAVYEALGFRTLGLVGALAVLEENGFVVHNEAGASGGALLAALHGAGYSAAELREVFAELDTRRFADRQWTGRLPMLSRSASLLVGQGEFGGQYLLEWTRHLLAARGVRTFADFRTVDAADPRVAYRVHVFVSDMTEERLLDLPGDARMLGIEPDELEVALAVRMSIAVPLFLEPVRLKDPAGVEHVLLDGTVLSDFPVGFFDQEQPQWPTFGIRLEEAPGAKEAGKVKGRTDVLALLERVVRAQERKQAYVGQRDVARTIFVQSPGISATDLDVPPAQLDALHQAGRRAAQQFLSTWDWEAFQAAFPPKTSSDGASGGSGDGAPPALAADNFGSL